MPTTLQQKTYETWVGLHDVNHAHRTYSTPDEDQAFQQELATYGDRQAPVTWERAFAALKAKFLADAATDDGQFLIEFHLVQAPLKEGWASLVPDVIRQMLMIPDAARALATGWAAIKEYGYAYTTPEAMQQVLAGLEEALNGETKRQITSGN